MPSRRGPRAKTLIALAVAVLLALGPAWAEESHWKTAWGDPDTLIAPLDLQFLSGFGQSPSLIGIIDPGSNRAKVRYLDLDGHPLGPALLANGPSPWDSQIPPFSGFSGPQLPFAVSHAGVIEAAMEGSSAVQFFQWRESAPRLSPVGGGARDARSPGDVEPLPFAAEWWGVDPMQGTLVAASLEGMYLAEEASGYEWRRHAVGVPEDLLNLEVGPDGTIALLSGEDRARLDLTADLYEPSGLAHWRIDIASHLSGSGLVLDSSNLGKEAGYLLLVDMQAPYPVSLTQHLNDYARGILHERDHTPFLFSFSWTTGEMQALTPLVDLPLDLDVLRVSGDQYTTALLIRTPRDAALLLLATASLTEVGTVPLELGAATLAGASAVGVTAAEELLVIGPRQDPAAITPLLALTRRTVEGSLTRHTLLPMPAGTGFDAGGLMVTDEGLITWGGQVYDSEGPVGSVWQQRSLDGEIREANLFSRLPTDFFSLDALDPTARLPYLLAQAQDTDGTIRALVGTFDPPEVMLLALSPDGSVTLESPPEDFEASDWGEVTLLSDSLGGLVLAARLERGGKVMAWGRGRGSRVWTKRERLPLLGLWPVAMRPDGDCLWLAPEIGLVESDEQERITRIAANPNPLLGAVTDVAADPRGDYLLAGPLGQLWRVDAAGYEPVAIQNLGEVNEALLDLEQALWAVGNRDGQFPATIGRTLVESELKSFPWERLWEQFAGGAPLFYTASGGRFDCVLWSFDAEQTLWYMSEEGIREFDPEVGFVPASQRGLGFDNPLGE